MRFAESLANIQAEATDGNRRQQRKGCRRARVPYSAARPPGRPPAKAEVERALAGNCPLVGAYGIDMAPPPLLSTKKCPHCQQWSAWQQSPDDRCEHCGELLDPQAHQSNLAREQVAQQKLPALVLVEIKPEDGAVVRFFKTIVRGGQLAFAAILAFIVWVVTVLVG